MLPSFFSVRFVEPDWPGCSVPTSSESQAPLALVSVEPPPVDRHTVPVLTLLLSTSVPVANLLVGLVVSAVKDATDAAAVKPARAVTITPVSRIRPRIALFLRLGSVRRADSVARLPPAGA